MEKNVYSKTAKVTVNFKRAFTELIFEKTQFNMRPNDLHGTTDRSHLVAMHC